MSLNKTTTEFVSIAEAHAHFLKHGYYTADLTDDSAIMEKYANGAKVSEVVINRVGFMHVVAKLNESAV